jgi:hypothetical protein
MSTSPQISLRLRDEHGRLCRRGREAGVQVDSHDEDNYSNSNGIEHGPECVIGHGIN